MCVRAFVANCWIFDKVMIYVSTEACVLSSLTENRLKNFVIEVQQHENIVHTCASNEAALKKGETKSFLCKQGSIGNIVRIKLTGTGILSLCEVEVFGTPGKSEHHRYINIVNCIEWWLFPAPLTLKLMFALKH